MAANAKPLVAIRKYIKWGDRPAGEPTSTVVLGSPEGRFVDVRLLLPLPEDDAATGSVGERVDWAFAGTSRRDDGADPPLTSFEHWVDSRHADAEAVRDEGSMAPGDAEGEVLERGRSANPATGVEEDFEECWIERDGEAGWVLRHEGRGRAARGLMARIGGQVQGVLRVGADIGVGRWRVGKDEEPREVVAEVGSCAGFPKGALGRSFEVGEAAEAEDGTRWVCVETW